MMEYISSNFPAYWIALGFALLAIEVLVFGFSTIILLFAGIGAVTTGLLMSVGVLPETWTAGLASFGIATGISAALLWRTMQNLQNSSQHKSGQSSDFIGIDFILTQDISVTEPGKHPYSGVEWRVEIDKNSEHDSLKKGDRVEVTSVDAGIFRVKKYS
jgi:membrane protein implicated in regulation of membrane protease activity